MVSRREIGILAVLAIGGFFLSRRASGSDDFGSGSPFNFEREKRLQQTFDEIGDVLEQQDTALLESQRLLQQSRQQQTASFSGVRPPLNPTSGILTSTSVGRDIIVNTFGKVPSNFVQGFKSACSCGSRRCSALQFGKCNQATGLFEK